MIRAFSSDALQIMCPALSQFCCSADITAMSAKYGTSCLAADRGSPTDGRFRRRLQSVFNIVLSLTGCGVRVEMTQ